jgi:hypothetical protein
MNETWSTLVISISGIIGTALVNLWFWRFRRNERLPQDYAVLLRDFANLKERLDEAETERRDHGRKIEDMRVAHASLRAFVMKRANGDAT